jgi:hypothetical protein
MSILVADLGPSDFPLLEQSEFFSGLVGKKGGYEAGDKLIAGPPETAPLRLTPLDDNKLRYLCAKNAQAGTPFAGTGNRRKTNLLIWE